MQVFHSFTPDVIVLLQKGLAGVIPTDTVYGVVALLSNKTAVSKIYDIKKRDANKPVGTILIANEQQLSHIVDQKYVDQAHQFWPGPISVILPVDDEFKYAHKGIESLPFRIPNSKELVLLLEQTGPLATSSANIEGQPPAGTIQEAVEYFGTAVDFYVDGGDLSERKPSKIIKLLTNGQIIELRN